MPTTQRSFKRPFQPSIHSYFTRTNNTISDTNAPPSPTLPATIQSSFLNVGMIVRKSTPEGYQTKSKMSCVFSTTSLSGVPSDQLQLPYQQSISGSAPVPFAGLLPHDVQPDAPTVEDLPPLQFDGEDWDLQDGFSSSQDSIIRPIHISTSSSAYKRRREDADDDLDVEAQPVSPRSKPISHTRMSNLDVLRVIAVLMSRRKTMGGRGTHDMDIDVGDFVDVGVLRPVDWGET